MGMKRISLIRGKTRAGYNRQQAAEKETWPKRRTKGEYEEDCTMRSCTIRTSHQTLLDGHIKEDEMG